MMEDGPKFSIETFVVLTSFSFKLSRPPRTIKRVDSIGSVGF